MNVYLRKILWGAGGFVIILAALSTMQPLHEAWAASATITAKWGVNNAGSDGAGGCVSPTGTDCSSGSTWGSGQSKVVTSSLIFNITKDPNYVFRSISSCTTATHICDTCSTIGTVCKLDLADPNSVTIPSVPGADRTITLRLKPSSTYWSVDYNAVDASTLAWTDPPPSSADHGLINNERLGTLPGNVLVTKLSPYKLTFNSDPLYAIKQVEYSIDGGTNWIAAGAGAPTSACPVPATDPNNLAGYSAASNSLVTTSCADTADYYDPVKATTYPACSWCIKPTVNTMVRASYESWQSTIGLTKVTTAGDGTIVTSAIGSVQSAWSGGTATESVQKNDDVTFTITPDANSRIFDVKVKDSNSGGAYTTETSIGVVTGYTFKNVQSDTNTLKVTFAPAVTPFLNYSQMPPFAGASGKVLPNILLLFDNSGSMASNAYSGCDSNKPYSTGYRYYGLFNPDRAYTYNSSTDTYTDTGSVSISTSNACATTSPYTGNYLNSRVMSRIDVIKMATIGGKKNPTASAPNRIEGYTDDLKNTTPFYIDKKGDVLNLTGIVQDLVDNGKARLGLMKFSSSSNGGVIVNSMGDTSANIVTSISAMTASTSTPLTEALYEAARYFENTTNYCGTSCSSYTGLTDPLLYNCAKNFVLIMTDGNSNSASKLPGVGSNHDATGAGTNSWSNSGCTSAAALTDSTNTAVTVPFDADQWADRIYKNEGNALYKIVPDSGGNCDSGLYLGSVAYMAHVTDLRPDTNTVIGKPGTQNMTTYGVFAFNEDGSSPTLMNACKYGAFKDTNGNGTYGVPVPDLDTEWYTRTNSDGTPRTASWAASSTVPCPVTKTTSNTAGTNMCTSTGSSTTNGTCTCRLPDSYYEAGEGTSLADALNDAVKDIIAQVSSGTAASILSNSSGYGANLLQAVFFPDKTYKGSTELVWSGELQNIWYYVDPFLNSSKVLEDTDANGILNLSKDYEVRFRFNGSQTVADLYDKNGVKKVADLATDDVKSLWRAGKQLWLTAASARNIYTSTGGSTLTSFTTANSSTLTPYLQTAPASIDPGLTEAGSIISYVRGESVTSYRDRSVQMTSGGAINQWKLGDIISSTPRTQSTLPLSVYNLKTVEGGYGDASYNAFVNTANYKQNRGMVYTGANDGMLHAFKLGKLTMISGKNDLAQLTGGDGSEQWAYIPFNALPYLRYLADGANYKKDKHAYFVDGTPTLVDVSIGSASGCATYSDCAKNSDGSTWRTTLITGMGLGGASRIKGYGCASAACVETPIKVTISGTDTGIGYSSYFALDVTGQYFNSSGVLQNNPTLLWEFNHPDLGYATSGAAIVKIKAQTSSVPDNSKNGKWFAVFGSGPTGPISDPNFMGQSDKELKIFVVDIGATPPFVLNTNYWEISTGIKYAFAGSITNGVIDADRWKGTVPGNYQDDAIYVGYTKNTDQSAGTGTWTDGGILRIITKENPDPTKWSVSKLIDGIGSVTANIAKLQDRGNHKLWIYAGTGRYTMAADDNTSRRQLLGLMDPCYKQSFTHGTDSSSSGLPGTDSIDDACTTTITNQDCGTLSPTTDCLVNQTSSATSTISSTSSGWRITLDANDSTYGAERVVSDPVALTNGTVFFTTFKPTANACDYGGKTYLWGLTYNTAFQMSASASTGKVLMQQSTGSFNQKGVDKSSFTDKETRRTGDPTDLTDNTMKGKPPSDAPPVLTNANLKPVKKILHIMER